MARTPHTYSVNATRSSTCKFYAEGAFAFTLLTIWALAFTRIDGWLWIVWIDEIRAILAVMMATFITEFITLLSTV